MVDVREAMMNRHFPVDQRVVRWDVVPIARHQWVRVLVLSVSAEARQAIRLGVDSGTGVILQPGEQLNDISLLAEPGSSWDVEVESPNGVLSVYQRWEGSYFGGAPAWMSQGDYAGMLVQCDGAHREYHCNNGLLHDSFDKLVFSVELLA
jgi:hypothetical protein